MDRNRSCPSPETLATFVDGRLDRPSTDEVTGHLDRCPVCREIAAETIAVLDEMKGSRVRFRTVPYVAAAAAVAAMAIGLFLYAAGFLDRMPGQERLAGATARYLQQAVRMAQEGAELPAHIRPDSGYAFSGATRPDSSAFRVGVELVDLQTGRGVRAARQGIASKSARSGPQAR